MVFPQRRIQHHDAGAIEDPLQHGLERLWLAPCMKDPNVVVVARETSPHLRSRFPSTQTPRRSVIERAAHLTVTIISQQTIHALVTTRVPQRFGEATMSWRQQDHSSGQFGSWQGRYTDAKSIPRTPSRVSFRSSFCSPFGSSRFLPPSWITSMKQCLSNVLRVPSAQVEVYHSPPHVLTRLYGELQSLTEAIRSTRDEGARHFSTKHGLVLTVLCPYTAPSTGALRLPQKLAKSA